MNILYSVLHYCFAYSIVATTINQSNLETESSLSESLSTNTELEIEQSIYPRYWQFVDQKITTIQTYFAINSRDANYLRKLSEFFIFFKLQAAREELYSLLARAESLRVQVEMLPKGKNVKKRLRKSKKYKNPPNHKKAELEKMQRKLKDFWNDKLFDFCESISTIIDAENFHIRNYEFFIKNGMDPQSFQLNQCFKVICSIKKADKKYISTMKRLHNALSNELKGYLSHPLYPKLYPYILDVDLKESSLLPSSSVVEINEKIEQSLKKFKLSQNFDMIKRITTKFTDAISCINDLKYNVQFFKCVLQTYSTIFILNEEFMKTFAQVVPTTDRQWDLSCLIKNHISALINDLLGSTIEKMIAAKGDLNKIENILTFFVTECDHFLNTKAQFYSSAIQISKLLTDYISSKNISDIELFEFISITIIVNEFNNSIEKNIDTGLVFDVNFLFEKITCVERYFECVEKIKCIFDQDLISVDSSSSDSKNEDIFSSQAFEYLSVPRFDIQYIKDEYDLKTNFVTDDLWITDPKTIGEICSDFVMELNSIENLCSEAFDEFEEFTVLSTLSFAIKEIRKDSEKLVRNTVDFDQIKSIADNMIYFLNDIYKLSDKDLSYFLNLSLLLGIVDSTEFIDGDSYNSNISELLTMETNRLNHLTFFQKEKSLVCESDFELLIKTLQSIISNGKMENQKFLYDSLDQIMQEYSENLSFLLEEQQDSWIHRYPFEILDTSTIYKETSIEESANLLEKVLISCDSFESFYERFHSLDNAEYIQNSFEDMGYYDFDQTMLNLLQSCIQCTKQYDVLLPTLIMNHYCFEEEKISKLWSVFRNYFEDINKRNIEEFLLALSYCNSTACVEKNLDDFQEKLILLTKEEFTVYPLSVKFTQLQKKAVDTYCDCFEFFENPHRVETYLFVQTAFFIQRFHLLEQDALRNLNVEKFCVEFLNAEFSKEYLKSSQKHNLYIDVFTKFSEKTSHMNNNCAVQTFNENLSIVRNIFEWSANNLIELYDLPKEFSRNDLWILPASKIDSIVHSINSSFLESTMRIKENKELIKIIRSQIKKDEITTQSDKTIESLSLKMGNLKLYQEKDVTYSKFINGKLYLRSEFEGMTKRASFLAMKEYNNEF